MPITVGPYFLNMFIKRGRKTGVRGQKPSKNMEHQQSEWLKTTPICTTRYADVYITNYEMNIKLKNAKTLYVYNFRNSSGIVLRVYLNNTKII